MRAAHRSRLVGAAGQRPADRLPDHGRRPGARARRRPGARGPGTGPRPAAPRSTWASTARARSCFTPSTTIPGCSPRSTPERTPANGWDCATLPPGWGRAMPGSLWRPSPSPTGTTRCSTAPVAGTGWNRPPPAGSRPARTTPPSTSRAPTPRSSWPSPTRTTGCCSARTRSGAASASPRWPGSWNRGSRWSRRWSARWPRNPASRWPTRATWARSPGRSRAR